MKILPYIFPLLLLACTNDDPMPTLKPKVYRQEVFIDSEKHGTREYTLYYDKTFQFTQGGMNIGKVKMNGWYSHINDSVLDFTWRTIMDVWLHEYWNDTTYYHTYAIFNHERTAFWVQTYNGQSAHPNGGDFTLIE